MFNRNRRVLTRVTAAVVAVVCAVSLLTAVPAAADHNPGGVTPNPTGPIVSMAMLDASDQRFIAALSYLTPVTVTLDDPANGSYALRADVFGDTAVGSVGFELSGPVIASRTENVAPYSLWGDTHRGGGSHLYGHALPAGNYTVVATSYENARRGGDVLNTVSLSFTVVAASEPDPLEGFSVVDASTQGVLAILTDGDSVEVADPDGGSYGIRAGASDGASVGSVRLELTGAKTVSQTENIAPYSLYGDNNRGADTSLNGASLPTGSYTFTATAYAGFNLSGDVLDTLEISFTVAELS